MPTLHDTGTTIPEEVSGRRHGRDGNRKGSVPNFAQMATPKLLSSYWDFVTRPLALIAGLIISRAGKLDVTSFLKGDLADDVAYAVAMQKAHGRNISPDEVASDLELTIPQGYMPSFDLYLQAAGITPVVEGDRKTSNAIKSAIKKKLAEARAAPG